MASWRGNLPSIGVRALATAQGRWILIGASESLAKQGSPTSGHRLIFCWEMFFCGGPSWTFFWRPQWGSFWASCGSLVASQNPSALCIKSGWAGASVAFKIRSEYLKKEALLLLGGPGGLRGALRKPKKCRLGSLAASGGRRTDSLHIHNGSWPLCICSESVRRPLDAAREPSRKFFGFLRAPLGHPGPPKSSGASFSRYSERILRATEAPAQPDLMHRADGF